MIAGQLFGDAVPDTRDPGIACKSDTSDALVPGDTLRGSLAPDRSRRSAIWNPHHQTGTIRSPCRSEWAVVFI